jgi:hypothetical protein
MGARLNNAPMVAFALQRSPPDLGNVSLLCLGWRALTLTACPMRRTGHSRKPERKRAGHEYFVRAPRPGMAMVAICQEPCDAPVQCSAVV